MVTTILQVTIPLAYIFFGILGGRYAWQHMREVPAVYGTQPKCSLIDNPYHEHHNGCYEVISEKSGDNFDATVLAILAFFCWPVMALIIAGWYAITWRTPQTTAEKTLAIRKAETELKQATLKMEAAQRTWKALLWPSSAASPRISLPTAA
jgi:hypothetical protein